VAGSVSILLIYVAVNVAHLKLHRLTGARPFLLWLAVFVSLAFVFLLIGYEGQSSPNALISLTGVFVLSFVAEWAYRQRTQRVLQTRA